MITTYNVNNKKMISVNGFRMSVDEVDKASGTGELICDRFVVYPETDGYEIEDIENETCDFISAYRIFN